MNVVAAVGAAVVLFFTVIKRKNGVNGNKQNQIVVSGICFKMSVVIAMNQTVAHQYDLFSSMWSLICYTTNWFMCQFCELRFTLVVNNINNLTNSKSYEWNGVAKKRNVNKR